LPIPNRRGVLHLAAELTDASGNAERPLPLH
jgi:hypothetical protein